MREEDWGLDPTGNWSDYTEKTSGSTDLDQDRTHNKVNEITDVTETTGTAWVTPAQDKNGNMTTVPKPSSPANGLTLKYDAWNRLVEVKDGATVVGKYEYDGLTRRVKRHLDSDSPGSPDGIDTYVHYFYNAGWQVLETRDTTTESDQPENLQPDYQYAWSGRYIDAPILRDENTDQDSLCDDDRLYYLTDANFNVTTLTDTSGDAVEHYQYDPYGTPTIYDATWSNIRSTSSYDNMALYTGREFDAETGLYYYRNRYYNSHLGRFVNRDPIQYRGSKWNLYAYVSGRPTVRLDPSGQLPVIDDILDEAERRRGHGPWGDSAQHCWAACYIGAVYGRGAAAAIMADIGELFAPSTDMARDAAAHHLGGAIGDGLHLSGGLLGWCLLRLRPSLAASACDKACSTWP